MKGEDAGLSRESLLLVKTTPSLERGSLRRTSIGGSRDDRSSLVVGYKRYLEWLERKRTWTSYLWVTCGFKKCNYNIHFGIMQSTQQHKDLGVEIQNLLKLENPPIAISFTNEMPAEVKKFNESVPSGCVFWFKAFHDEFYTTREDHANCNIGSFTHGFVEPSQVSLDACPDINLMVQSRYLALDDFPGVPRMNKLHKFVIYAPLEASSREPDVVLVVCNAEQAMLISEAAGTIRTMGKPTCSAIPYAYNEDGIAISFGCITNRVRTGLKSGELVATIPRKQLGSFVERLRQTVQSNNAVSQAVTAMLESS